MNSPWPPRPSFSPIPSTHSYRPPVETSERPSLSHQMLNNAAAHKTERFPYGYQSGAGNDFRRHAALHRNTGDQNQVKSSVAHQNTYESSPGLEPGSRKDWRVQLDDDAFAAGPLMDKLPMSSLRRRRSKTLSIQMSPNSSNNHKLPDWVRIPGSPHEGPDKTSSVASQASKNQDADISTTTVVTDLKGKQKAETNFQRFQCPRCRAQLSISLLKEKVSTPDAQAEMENNKGS